MEAGRRLVGRRLREKQMPKIKTRRGAAKRFRKTGTGKLARNRAYHSHILTKKDAKRKRRLRTGTGLDQTNVKAVRKMCPYL
jgi:large subunit ribosomal protein L35